jgi:hypothetical protein
MNRRKFLILSGASVVGSYASRHSIAQTVSSDNQIDESVEALRPAAWLTSYSGVSSSVLFNDQRFAELLATKITAFPTGMPSGSSLLDLIRAYTSEPNQVVVTDNKYVMASGCMAHCGFNRAFVWIDRRIIDGAPRMIAAFVTVDGATRRVSFLTSCTFTNPRDFAPRNFRVSFADWLRTHTSAKRWDGGRLNKFEVKGPSNSPLHMSPLSLGLRQCRCEPSLTVGTIV